jgi:hypothetical protein
MENEIKVYKTMMMKTPSDPVILGIRSLQTENIVMLNKEACSSLLQDVPLCTHSCLHISLGCFVHSVRQRNIMERKYSKKCFVSPIWSAEAQLPVAGISNGKTKLYAHIQLDTGTPHM